MNKPQYPFGSCQYENVYETYQRFINNPTQLRHARARTGFTKEIVLLLLNATADCAHDLWSAAPYIAELAIENWVDIDTVHYDGDDSLPTGFACAALAICFNLEYADFPEYST